MEDLLFKIRIAMGGLSENQLSYRIKLNHYTYKVLKQGTYHSKSALLRIIEELTKVSELSKDIFAKNHIEVLIDNVRSEILKISNLKLE